MLLVSLQEVKMTARPCIFALLVLLSGCDARVRFESPQPEGGNDFLNPGLSPDRPEI